MGYLKKLLFYAGADPKEFKKCEPEIRKSNQKKLVFYLALSCVFLGCMSVVSCIVPAMTHNFLVYFLPFVICLALLITTLTLPNETGTMLTVFILLFTAVMFGMATYLGTFSLPDGQAATFFVFLILLPQLFTVRPVQCICSTLVFDVIFVICTLHCKSFEIARFDVLNAVVFEGVSAIVSTYLMTMMVENAIVRGKLRVVAESDLNTGLKNRNAYENHMMDYTLRCTTTLCCVYVDVNGLHALNNEKGHAEGDKMLQLVAQKLQDEFGSEDSYRVGGDEFVAFVLNEPYEQTKRRMKRFVAAVEISGYSVAVGAATHSAGGIDIVELVREAEQRMYIAKEKYYEKMHTIHR